MKERVPLYDRCAAMQSTFDMYDLLDSLLVQEEVEEIEGEEVPSSNSIQSEPHQDKKISLLLHSKDSNNTRKKTNNHSSHHDDHDEDSDSLSTNRKEDEEEGGHGRDQHDDANYYSLSTCNDHDFHHIPMIKNHKDSSFLLGNTNDDNRSSCTSFGGSTSFFTCSTSNHCTTSSFVKMNHHNDILDAEEAFYSRCTNALEKISRAERVRVSAQKKTTRRMSKQELNRSSSIIKKKRKNCPSIAYPNSITSKRSTTTTSITVPTIAATSTKSTNVSSECSGKDLRQHSGDDPSYYKQEVSQSGSILSCERTPPTIANSSAISSYYFDEDNLRHISISCQSSGTSLTKSSIPPKMTGGETSLSNKIARDSTPRRRGSAASSSSLSWYTRCKVSPNMDFSRRRMRSSCPSSRHYLRTKSCIKNVTSDSSSDHLHFDKNSSTKFSNDHGEVQSSSTSYLYHDCNDHSHHCNQSIDHDFCASTDFNYNSQDGGGRTCKQEESEQEEERDEEKIRTTIKISYNQQSPSFDHLKKMDNKKKDTWCCVKDVSYISFHDPHDSRSNEGSSTTRGFGHPYCHYDHELNDNDVDAAFATSSSNENGAVLKKQRRSKSPHSTPPCLI